MKRKRDAVVGSCLLCLVAAVMAADSTGPLPSAVVYPQRDLSKLVVWDVVRVVGPDRLIIRQGQEQETVRLAGISEPGVETGESSENYHGRAVAFLVNLLAGEQVRVQRGRSAEAGVQPVLPAVRLFREPDGLYVNLELVRQGYCRTASAGPASEQKLFAVYQERARQAGKGLWGISGSAVPAGEGKGADRVYVTKAGRKYHRGSCQFLAKSKIPMSLQEARNRGYAACKVCRPPE